MVMEKRKRIAGNYTYGNVAYNIEPERRPDAKPIKKTKIGHSRKAKKALKIKLKLMWYVALLGTMTFLVLSRAARINGLAADVRSIKEDITTVQKENADLEVKIASACNLKSIEKTATNSYKMITPDSNNVNYIQVEELSQIQEEKEDKEESSKVGFNIKKLFDLIIRR